MGPQRFLFFKRHTVSARTSRRNASHLERPLIFLIFILFFIFRNRRDTARGSIVFTVSTTGFFCLKKRYITRPTTVFLTHATLWHVETSTVRSKYLCPWSGKSQHREQRPTILTVWDFYQLDNHRRKENLSLCGNGRRKSGTV